MDLDEEDSMCEYIDKMCKYDLSLPKQDRKWTIFQETKMPKKLTGM